MRKIGLVGGMSWVSTLDYYKYINEGINQKLGGLNFAECVIYSVNYADIQATSWDNSFYILLAACESLKKSGVEALVLCANTAHAMAERLEEQTGLPIINVVTATAEAVNNQGLKKVGLLGTIFTMELDFYKDGLRNAGIEPIIPEDQDTRNFIQFTLREELGKGIIKPETKLAYLDIIADLIARGAEGIILGCTEIPLIISQADISVHAFDTTKIHAAAIVDYALK